MRKKAGSITLQAIAAWFFLYYPGSLWAAEYSLNSLRLSSDKDRIRLVFDFSGPVNHSLFLLNNPDRVVIDLEQVTLNTTLSEHSGHLELLKRIRSASHNGQDLRIVLDLAYQVRPQSFPLQPSGGYGHRLVVDLFNENRGNEQKAIKTIPRPSKLRDVIIAVDAGHGGKDPGSLGRAGSREKDVTLAIARRLAQAISGQQGMQAILIRDTDDYIDLRERTEKARKHKADMLVSIHADAFHAADAQGSSVYVLSLNGASSEAAKWLADKENASDLIGGIRLDDKDDLVASVLLDLSQTATIQSGLEVAREVLKELGKVNKLHKPEVQQAGFLVLKSPDIPSILVETAFLTNPAEERKLKSPAHQEKIVSAILNGVKLYFSQKAPPGTLLAQANDRLRQANHLPAVASSY